MTPSKAPSILKLIEMLQLDKHGWIIVDHWEADLCAVGIAANKNPRRLVYISSYNKPDGIFDYECETPLAGDNEEYEVEQEGQDVPFAEIMDVLKRHLET